MTFIVRLNITSKSFFFKACGTDDVCQTVTSATGVVTRSCSTAALCTNSTTTTCGTLDYANKQGPLCYVGRFGSTATPHACAKNQLCQVNITKKKLFSWFKLHLLFSFYQRTSVVTPYGTTISTGSCVTTCATGAYAYCCRDDLCNAYETTLNNKKCNAN